MPSFPAVFPYRSRSYLWIGLVLASALACVSRRVDDGGVRSRDTSVLTAEQLRSQYFATAYDAVAALRATWIQARGRDSFSNPTEVQVYLDDVRLGGAETLRSISMTFVVSIEHFDANTATARWGLGHGSGAINVATSGARKQGAP